MLRYESSDYFVKLLTALIYVNIPYTVWKCRDTGKHDLSFHCKVIIVFAGALLHKCFQDVLGTGQIFWNNGLTHSCMHSASFCIPLSLSFKHKQHRQHTFDLLTLSLSLQAWLFPRYHVSTLRYIADHFTQSCCRLCSKQL